MDYSAGRNSMHFSVDHIDVSHVKPSRLTNAGLLTATLLSAGAEIIDVNCVVQVQKEGDAYIRTVLNPLE